MRHTTLIGITFLCALFFAIGTTSAHAAVYAVDRNGVAQATFETTEDIYIEGECPSAAGETVRAYVVPDRSVWPSKTPLADQSGGAEAVELDEHGNIPRTKVWKSKTKIGAYDVVLDENGNGVHDSGEGCIDSTAATGFSVINPSTSLYRAFADKDHLGPNDHVWSFDEHSPERILLVFRLNTTDVEAVRFREIELETEGTGDDESDIERVQIIRDTNTNRIYDRGDKLLGSGRFNTDNGSASIEISERVDADDSIKLLVVYDFKESVSPGDSFIVTVRSIQGIGLSSDRAVLTRDLPIESGRLVIGTAEEAHNESVDEETNTPSDDSTGTPSRPVSPSGGGSVLGSIFERDQHSGEPIDLTFGLSIRTRAIIFTILLGLFLLWVVTFAIATLRE